MSDTSKGYRRSCQNDNRVRVVAVLPEGLIGEVDAWGIPAGMRSRTEAIKELIGKGLEAVSHASS
ncbi:hypothetical protein BiPBO1_22 [Brucella phage BiPBO1]|uniref:hypothetical protein n=1 Tax=Brucella phage BiPBO1 TaxID=1718278 RepID=UPI00078B1E71|nr:hypothetical protein BJD47_gp22 [Brucella phage BiPBO1]ALJ98236.1 hypothetical protein BiPBO1_22 [Brucella phage BiPBO1]